MGTYEKGYVGLCTCIYGRGRCDVIVKEVAGDGSHGKEISSCLEPKGPSSSIIPVFVLFVTAI